jgi:N-acetylmuramoyl-L-alanine amidase
VKKFLFLFFVILVLCPRWSFAQAISTEPVRILLVPGHDNEVWGTQYGNLKEAAMNRVLATQIYDILKKDKRFKVWITRDQLGYTKEFADYFSLHLDDIKAFKESAKQEMQEDISAGDFVPKEGAPHASVRESVALKLYGINKWTDENKMDAVIHIHFNDYFKGDDWKVGKYKGFVIYIPEMQLANAKTSAVLGANIFSELKTKYQVSNFPKESAGLVPDQKLIALGANDTLLSSVRSVLIEYGYIYEKKFRNSITRHKAYKIMADLTARGIKSYFLQSKI